MVTIFVFPAAVRAERISETFVARWGADQRKELEHRGRYITRPAIANEQLKRNRAGQVVRQLKSPYKDGTTHIVMSPLEFMQRLAALVPPALTSNPVRQAQGRPLPWRARAERKAAS